MKSHREKVPLIVLLLAGSGLLAVPVVLTWLEAKPVSALWSDPSTTFAALVFAVCSLAFLLAAAHQMLALRNDIRSARRLEAGQCVNCGYARGRALGALPCPECGKTSR